MLYSIYSLQNNIFPSFYLLTNTWGRKFSTKSGKPSQVVLMGQIKVCFVGVIQARNYLLFLGHFNHSHSKYDRTVILLELKDKNGQTFSSFLNSLTVLYLGYGGCKEGTIFWEHKDWNGFCTSRSEPAPGSVFHPRDKSGKIDCDLLQPFWCNIKVDPER